MCVLLYRYRYIQGTHCTFEHRYFILYFTCAVKKIVCFVCTFIRGTLKVLTTRLCAYLYCINSTGTLCFIFGDYCIPSLPRTVTNISISTISIITSYCCNDKITTESPHYYHRKPPSYIVLPCPDTFPCCSMPMSS